MLRQGVNPRSVTPQFLDSRELESLQDDPDLALTWRMLVHHLGLVRNSEFMATAGDARGCVVWTASNAKIRDEAERYGHQRDQAGDTITHEGSADLRAGTLDGFPAPLDVHGCRDF